MSVVVWDGKTLAADRMGVCAGLGVTTTKMSKRGDTVLAWTGDSDRGHALADWYWNGEDKTSWPKFQSDGEGSTRLIVVQGGVCKVYEQEPYALLVLDTFAAWGSGRDFAYGALEMGADARRAVEVTCKHNVDCGKGIEAYDLLLSDSNGPLTIRFTGDDAQAGN